MKIVRKTLLILPGLMSLGLSACGEGWEVVPYSGQVPYTEERTAGSGVAYVRAHLLPEKGPVLVPEVVSPVHEETVKDAAPLFNTKQMKK